MCVFHYLPPTQDIDRMFGIKIYRNLANLPKQHVTPTVF